MNFENSYIYKAANKNNKNRIGTDKIASQLGPIDLK